MTDLPPTCAIGFKEWSGVCDALTGGLQTIILRKGGIEEGPGGFTPEHPSFWLYPTRLHESQQGLRIETGPTPTPPPPSSGLGTTPIRGLAVVDSIYYVDREDALDALEPFHIWTWETVDKRFHYRRPGLWVLGVRVWSRERPTEVPVTVEQLGCKTWVELDPPLETAGLAPAVDDAEWERRRRSLAAVLGAPPDAGKAGNR